MYKKQHIFPEPTPMGPQNEVTQNRNHRILKKKKYVIFKRDFIEKEEAIPDLGDYDTE